MNERHPHSTFALTTLAALLSCTPPGKGPRAEAGYERAAPILTALEGYHAQHNRYPDSLADLASDQVPRSTFTKAPFDYRRAGDDFELSFRYFGPGVNDCVFRASKRAWACSGHL